MSTHAPNSKSEHFAKSARFLPYTEEEMQVLALSDRDRLRLEDISDLIGSFAYWPAHMRSRMLSTHLKFQDRYQLTLFLLANRCPPFLIAEWYITRRMLKDKSARMQVADIIRQHRDGKLQEHGRTAFVMKATETLPRAERGRYEWQGVGDTPACKVQTIATPNFAFDAVHSIHWDEALGMLNF